MSVGSAIGRALARAALVGNPSDGYAGATLALTLPERRAEVHALLGRGSIDPPSELVAAAVARFEAEIAPGAPPSDLRWQTSIPRSVGLGGSSAIVIATLRALCALHAVAPGPLELAKSALATEAEDLGIAAGMQDRLAQAFEGLTFMDFTDAEPRVESLEEGLLPPLLIAWRGEASGDSGAVHAELRRRFERGDPLVRAAMADLAGLARRAKDALLASEVREFAVCVDASFDARRRIMPLDERHVSMIQRARDAGASANYTGSGGAIVAVCRDPAHRAEVRQALAELGCTALG